MQRMDPCILFSDRPDFWGDFCCCWGVLSARHHIFWHFVRVRTPFCCPVKPFAICSNRCHLVVEYYGLVPCILVWVFPRCGSTSENFLGSSSMLAPCNVLSVLSFTIQKFLLQQSICCSSFAVRTLSWWRIQVMLQQFWAYGYLFFLLLFAWVVIKGCNQRCVFAVICASN